MTSYCKISLKPLTAREAKAGYKAAALRNLFGSNRVSPHLPFSRSEFFQSSRQYSQGMSISGVQQKLSIKVNEQRMLALGYNTYVYKLVSFIIAGMVAGLAGFLFAAIDGFVAPQLLSWSESGIAMMIVILGGMGTLFGPILGAVGYVGLEEVFKSHGIVGFVADHWQIPMGLFVIAVVLFLPSGLGGAVARLVAPARVTESEDEDD